MRFSIEIQLLRYIYIFKALSPGISSVYCLRRQHLPFLCKKRQEKKKSLPAFLCLNKGHHRKVDCVFHRCTPAREFRICCFTPGTAPNCWHTSRDKHKTNQFQCSVCSQLHILDVINCVKCFQFMYRERFAV